MTKLTDKLFSMHEGYAFEVSDNPQRGDTTGDNWIKNDEVKQLCKLLKLKPLRKINWGDTDCEIDGQNVDICADRHKPVIVISVGNQYDKRIRIKGGLTSKQVKNLRSKIEKLASDKNDQQAKNSMQSDMRQALSKAGITADKYNKAVTVNGEELYYRDGELHPSGSIYYKGGVSVDTGASEKDIDKLLNNIKKDILKVQKERMKNVEKANKHLDEIKAYMESE